jgi:hypothetical protein
LCATADGRYPSLACIPLPKPLPVVPPVATAMRACIRFQFAPIQFGSMTSGARKVRMRLR